MDVTERVAGLEGVSKRFGTHVALDGVSLGIERGKVTALLGPNGAGKSTTVALLLGLVRADEGRVDLFGHSPHVLAARRRIGVMLQTAGLVETLRVRELLELTSSYYPRPLALAEVAALAGIDGLLGRRYGALSGGQQRRVQFALAVCGRPELLFLDEPTTGLDIEAREALWAVVLGLVAEGCAVLLTTHYLEEAEALAHRVEVLVGGRIVAAGSVDDVRAMGVRRRIRCVSRVAVEEVRGWEGVESVVEEVGRASGGAAVGEDCGDLVGAAGAVTARVGGDVVRNRRRLEIAAVEAEPVVRRLLESDPGLRELEVERAGLAEALVRITRAPIGALGGVVPEVGPASDVGRGTVAKEREVA